MLTDISLSIINLFRDCITELLGVVCTMTQTIKGLNEDFNTWTSQICISKELWLLLLRGNTSSGGVSVLACSFLSCSPSLSLYVSVSLLFVPPSLFVVCWPLLCVQMEGQCCGLLTGCQLMLSLFQNSLLPSLSIFHIHTQDLVEFDWISCVCIYLFMCSGIQKSENWDLK